MCFHLSHENNSDEPDFNSFWNSHCTESTQLTYKIIIPMSAIQHRNIYIRPHDNAVSIEGDYTGPAHLSTDFPWYNKKLYLLKSLHMLYKLSLLVWPTASLQMIGDVQDLLNKVKKNTIAQ